MAERKRVQWMKKTIRTGDFYTFGTRIFEDSCTFTFPVETDSVPAILLYDRASGEEKERIVLPPCCRLGHVWSATLTGYDFKKLSYQLERDGRDGTDRYARVICGREKWADEERYVKNYEVRGGFALSLYTWKNSSPDVAPEDMILYKAHLRGFSMKAPGVRPKSRGNYRGLMEKLPDLAAYGFNAIELMPVYEFEDLYFRSHLEMNAEGETVTVNEEPYAVNYWGYGTGYYFAPKASYFGGSDPDLHMKELVDCAHGFGMEIILEFSFEKKIPDDELIDALVYWVREYHIDGFHLLGAGLPAERVVANPYLSGTKILYNGFSYDLLNQERGGKHIFVTDDGFQYPLRRLQNHMDGNAAEFSEMLRRQNRFYGFVNYAASNTGMTLYDAYSYGDKHNEKNGENNRDGNNYNVSANNGYEGETKNKVTNRLRLTSVRTALLSVLVSQGIPMVNSGDGSLNSQSGNNNPYCQDNSLGWPDFGRKGVNQAMRDYLRGLIAFRKSHTCLSQADPVRFSDYLHAGLPDLSYHGREPWIMGIGAEKKALGILFGGAYGRHEEDEDVMLLYNFYYGEETFALPTLPGGKKWYFVNNTADFAWNAEGELLHDQKAAIVPGGTCTVLIGKGPKTKPAKERTGESRENAAEQKISIQKAVPAHE